VAEQCLDLGGVGAASAEPGGEGMPAAAGAQARDSGIGARGEDDLGDAGVSERPALPGPERAGVAVAHGKPG
jgi:hypothetical protein